MLTAIRTWADNRAKKRRDEFLKEVFDRCFVQPFEAKAETAREIHKRGARVAYEMQRDFLHAHLGRRQDRKGGA